MWKILFILSVCIPHVASAASGGIDFVYKYAWGMNIGWVNFNTGKSDVIVTDASLSGMAWNENTGWINLWVSTSTHVKNDGYGNLSGFAWGENSGYIDFSGVTIDSEGYFHGFATSPNIGTINFNCANTNSCSSSNFKVKTFWKAPIVVEQTITGGGPGQPVVFTSSSTVVESLQHIVKEAPFIESCKVVDSYFPPTLTKDLKSGSKDAEVIDVQKFLNTHGFPVAQKGKGSLGKETVKFGSATKNALAKYQRTQGLTDELGFLGPKTRAHINNMTKKTLPGKVAICQENMCPVYISKHIQYGKKNDSNEVLKLKKFLVEYEGAKNIPMTPLYDKNTFNAVVKFQEKYSAEILGPWQSIKGNGYVYKTTERQINRLYCQYEFNKIVGIIKK